MRLTFPCLGSRAACALALTFVISSAGELLARPVHTRKGGEAPLTFLRQVNTKSNVEFSYANRGMLFSAGNNIEGLVWPRGSNDSYLFGSGLWFATKKTLADEEREGWSFTGSVPSRNSLSILSLKADPIGRQLFAATPAGVYVWSDTMTNWRLDTVFASAISSFARLPSGTLVAGLTSNFGGSGTKPRLFFRPEGASWQPANIVNLGIMAISNLGAANVQGTIWTPDATGKQWIARGSAGYSYGSKNYLFSASNNAVILAAYPSLLALSRDTGVTWDTISHPGTITGISIVDDTVIMIGTAGQGIQLSFDRGVSWIPYNHGLENLNVHLLQSNDEQNFVAVTDSGAFVTNWGSGTWINRAPGLGWSGLITCADLDTTGALHAGDSMFEVFTQWQSPRLPPGERKLCDLGYNPNSGAGWYMEGEASQAGLTTGTDGADPNAKYISYVSPRYDATTGKYIPGSSTVVPSPYYSWPVWDTSNTKRFDRNYYFGDYVSDVNMREASHLMALGSKPNPKPGMFSEEDIVNLYSDEDVTNNPEFHTGTGYPLGIDVQEVIYSWSFGRYNDMIFVRYKVKNSSKDTLRDCWIAPAFDPDLDAAVGGSSNDANSYVNDSLVASMADTASVSRLREPYRTDPTKLNMAVQWRNYNQPPNGKQYGMIGISFLESPVVDGIGNLIPNDDSAALHGYGPNSLFQTNQIGLSTVRDWTIVNDPASGDLRYDFVSSREHDSFSGEYTDERLLMSTGPFTLAPGNSAEATLALTFAHVSDTSYKQNFGALLLLTDFAHQVFGEVDSNASGGTTNYFVNNFQVSPPNGVHSEQASSGIAIQQPYPNPFLSDCSIVYRTSFSAPISVTVSDILGRAVQSFSVGEIPAGEHSLSIDGSKFLPGTYRVTVNAGQHSQSVSMVRAQ